MRSVPMFKSHPVRTYNRHQLPLFPPMRNLTWEFVKDRCQENSVTCQENSVTCIQLRICSPLFIRYWIVWQHLWTALNYWLVWVQKEARDDYSTWYRRFGYSATRGREILTFNLRGSSLPNMLASRQGAGESQEVILSTLQKPYAFQR